MSFAGLVGSAMVGGAVGAAESWGDKLKEDAKNKRLKILEENRVISNRETNRLNNNQVNEQYIARNNSQSTAAMELEKLKHSNSLETAANLAETGGLIATAKAQKEADDNAKPKSGWTSKSATDYFTKQAYDQLGVKTDSLGQILGEVEKTDFTKARAWIAMAQDRWAGTNGQEDPAQIVDEVYNDEYALPVDNEVSQDGSPTPSEDLYLMQAREAIRNGKSENAVKKVLTDLGISPLRL